jgi:hypothetical protein
MTTGLGVPGDVPATAIAIGWATVELDRAAAELAGSLALRSDFRPGAGSVVLGARVRISETTLGDRTIALVLLEPSTEGRLAAHLARFGEGWAATWVRAPASQDAAGPGGAAGLGGPGEAGISWWPGPLGPERLDAGNPPAGPFRLVARTATIEP